MKRKLTKREDELRHYLLLGLTLRQCAERMSLRSKGSRTLFDRLCAKEYIEGDNRQVQLLHKVLKTEPEVILPYLESPRSVTIDSAAHSGSNLWEKLMMLKIGSPVIYSGHNYEIFDFETDHDGYNTALLIEADFKGSIDAGDKAAMILVRDFSKLQAVA